MSTQTNLEEQETSIAALQSLPNLSPNTISKIQTMKCRHDEILTLLQMKGIKPRK
jgi:hypothetical protein